MHLLHCRMWENHRSFSLSLMSFFSTPAKEGENNFNASKALLSLAPIRIVKHFSTRLPPGIHLAPTLFVDF